MDLQRLQKSLGYNFSNQDILAQALTHRSAGNQNNERLEFLGDAILGFEVAENLFQQHPSASEGQLSRTRAQLVKRETLAAIARKLDLGQYLILGPGELRSGGQTRDSILADAVEAIMAAVYLDSDIDNARKLVRHLLDDQLTKATPLEQDKDAKTRLQEYLQARGKALPLYKVISVTGSHHDQLFVTECLVDDPALKSKGQGKSRRKAEQQAA